MAEIFLERADLVRAQDHAARAVDYAGRSPTRSYVLYAYATAVRVFLAAGGYDAAVAQLRNAEAFVRGSRDDRFASFLASVQLEFHCRRGDLEAAANIVRARGLTPNMPISPDNDLEMTAFARYLIARGESDPAEELLSQLVRLARDTGHVQREIRALVLQALARESRGERTAALESLGQATSTGEPGGFT